MGGGGGDGRVEVDEKQPEFISGFAFPIGCAFFFCVCVGIFPLRRWQASAKVRARRPCSIWRPRPLTATPGPALMALREDEAGSLSPSTLMRRPNGAAETI